MFFPQGWFTISEFHSYGSDSSSRNGIRSLLKERSSSRLELQSPQAISNNPEQEETFKRSDKIQVCIFPIASDPKVHKVSVCWWEEREKGGGGYSRSSVCSSSIGVVHFAIFFQFCTLAIYVSFNNYNCSIEFRRVWRLSKVR